MDTKGINSMIAIVRQNNGLLQLLDYYKNDPDIKLADVLKKFSVMYKCSLKEHHFFNQYQLISSLLVYIVYPKEAYFNRIPEELTIGELDSGWGIQGGNKNNMKFRTFIQHLRNAIAHGDIKFNESLEFIFKDRDGKEIHFDSTSIQRFVRALAWWVMTDDITLKDLK